MLSDLRFAIRSFRRTPGFTVVAVLTLSLGVAATASVFALVKAVMLSALPFRDPDSLVLVSGRMNREAPREYPISYLDAASLSGERSTFSAVVPVTGVRSFNLGLEHEAEHITGEMTGAGFFELLGIPMMMGRSFSAQEAAAPGQRVVVISYALWARRFGSDRGVLGKTVQLNEVPYTVVGVAPERFTGLSDDADVWLPLGLAGGIYGAHYVEMREFRWLSAVARLAPGVSMPAAARRLADASSRLAREFPKENDRLTYQAQPLADAFFSSFHRPLLFLLAGAVLVLLIACTNVANLMLARGTTRQREMAVRLAIGASAARLARQQIIEMLALSGFSIALGLAGAMAATRVVRSSGALGLASFVSVRLDPLVVGVTAATVVACALSFALMPAFAAATIRPGFGLGDARRGSTGGRRSATAQRALIGAEVAVALVLLVGAALVTRGFARFMRTDLGFNTQSLLTLRLDLTADRYKDNEAVFALVRTLLEQAKAVQGVGAVAVEGPGFPTSGWYQATLRAEGADQAAAIPVRRHSVSAGYFSALSVPVVDGRAFDGSDVAGATRNVIVSKQLAERAFPGERAVGKRLLTEGAAPVALTIVGVAGDVEHGGRQTDGVAFADVYSSILQSPPRSPSLMTLMVRTTAPEAAVVSALRERLRQIDPQLAFYDVRTMDERIAVQTATGRFLVRLMLGFAGVGVLLAAIGVYGVIAYLVNQRTREIGIRMALGAGRGEVVSAVVRDALAPVGAGMIAGLILVVALRRLVASLLYGMSAGDPLTISIAVVLLVIVALVATVIPAARAVRVSPAIALRSD